VNIISHSAMKGSSFRQEDPSYSAGGFAFGSLSRGSGAGVIESRP
jgi:hypothetical protein